MGLDMYLYADKYVWNDDVKLNEAVSNVIDTKGFKLKNIRLDVGYWRKANQIHNWFFNNVQGKVDDCNEYEVCKEHLVELLDICKKVQADHSLAPALLPSQSGFFFGNTDYNEGYFIDIDDTIEIIEKALTLADKWSFIYRASW
jgi:hypothetical protein